MVDKIQPPTDRQTDGQRSLTIQAVRSLNKLDLLGTEQNPKKKNTRKKGNNLFFGDKFLLTTFTPRHFLHHSVAIGNN